MATKVKTLVPTKKAVAAKKPTTPPKPTYSGAGPVRPNAGSYTGGTALSNTPYGVNFSAPVEQATRSLGAVTPVSPSAGGGGGGDGSFGGGGGGAGGGAVGDAFAAPARTFDDFIRSNFGYNQLQNEQGRQLSEFDNDTLRQRQLTEADQGLRRSALQQSLSQMGGDWANDSASRGLLRSGLYLQGQDKVDQAGVKGNQDIDQLLSDLLSERGQARVSVQQQQRNALNDMLSKLSQEFNGQLGLAG